MFPALEGAWLPMPHPSPYFTEWLPVCIASTSPGLQVPQSHTHTAQEEADLSQHIDTKPGEGRVCLLEQQTLGRQHAGLVGGSMHSLIPMCLQGSSACWEEGVSLEQDSQVPTCAAVAFQRRETEEKLDKQEDNF